MTSTAKEQAIREFVIQQECSRSDNPQKCREQLSAEFDTAEQIILSPIMSYQVQRDSEEWDDQSYDQ